jgi:hypothetical protein
MREFIPCLYREQVLEGRQRGQDVLSCDVIELFAFSRIADHAVDTRMSPNSHQVTMRQACVIAPDGVPEFPHFDVQARLRAPLFGQFYAAMADLE